MAINTEIPNRDCYNFVLVRSDRDASVERAVPMRFVTYSENTVSRSIEWNGRRVHAIFLQNKESARKAWRLGWQNITRDWQKALDDAIPTPTSDPQKAIFEALHEEEWMTKKEIVAAAKIRDTEWRTAIRYLVDKGLAEQSGATNRSYRYRRGSSDG